MNTFAKTVVLISAFFVGTSSIMAEEKVSADDSRIVYVGRTEIQSPSVSFDYTATYIRLAFVGNRLQLTGSQMGKGYYNLWVDRDWTAEPDSVFFLSGDTTLVLFNSPKDRKKKSVHYLILQKRTEGEYGRLRIDSFACSGHFLSATPLKSRQLEFVGDSYTCGFGDENSVMNDPFRLQDESAAKSYAAVIARYFDADYVAVAHSGMGICRNYNNKKEGWYMPHRYMQTFDMDSMPETRWKANNSDFHPAITIIYLGTNDFSVGVTPDYAVFAAHFEQLFREIKDNYGDEHPIICFSKYGNPTLNQYVHQVVSDTQFRNVFHVASQKSLFHVDDREVGACNHPNYQANRKIAHILIPYIATITEWELNPDDNL